MVEDFITGLLQLYQRRAAAMNLMMHIENQYYCSGSNFFIAFTNNTFTFSLADDCKLKRMFFMVAYVEGVNF